MQSFSNTFSLQFRLYETFFDNKDGPVYHEFRKEISATILIILVNNRCFPDSTRRGDAEAGDHNQVQVALVFIPFS